MRTIIDLPENQIRALQAIALQEEKSRAALIREAVEQYITTRQPSRTQQRRATLEAAFGSWDNSDVDSVEYIRKLREEWDR